MIFLKEKRYYIYYILCVNIIVLKVVVNMTQCLGCDSLSVFKLAFISFA